MKLIKTKKQLMAFSIIESMIVIVIGSILIGITSLNFTASENRAKTTSVKNNMSTFQVMLETYAAEREGTLPDSVDTLQRVATTGILIGTERSNIYWKEIKNPFTTYTGKRRDKSGSVSTGLITDIGAYSDICPLVCLGSSLTTPPPIRGTVIYNPVKIPINIGSSIKTETRYYIYGSGGNALYINNDFKDTGSVVTQFVLTNNN